MCLLPGTAGYTGVYAQRYDADGNTAGWRNSGQYHHGGLSDAKCALRRWNDGGYLIVWSSREQDGDGNGVYFQRYDSSGNRVGGETLVNTTTVDSQWGGGGGSPERRGICHHLEFLWPGRKRLWHLSSTTIMQL